MPKVHKHQEHRPEVLAKQRLDDKEVENGLRAIYGDETTDFSKLEKRNWSLTRFLGRLVIVLGSLSVLTWAGYFAYLKLAPKSSADNLHASIETALSTQSGLPAEIVFTYENPKQMPLANLSVRSQIPDTFIITSASPEMTNPEEKAWDLGALDGHTKGTIILQGNWIAPTPSKQPIQFVSTYRPSNFNAEFTNVTSAQVTLDTSVAELTVTGPESLSADEVGSFEFAVRNTSQATLPAAELQLTLPDGFFTEEALPEFTKDLPPTWEIKDLPAGGEAQFALKGSFASGAGGFIPFTGTLAFVKDDQRLVQATKTQTVDVAAGDVAFSIALNGKSESLSTAPGTKINTNIVLENTTNSRITGASVLMDFQAVGRIPIRWGTFNYDGGRLTADGILWDNIAIGDIEPGEKIILSPSFELAGTLSSAEAKKIDIILHLKRGSGDLKSDLYSIYIGEEARISAILAPTQTPSEKELTITFSPPPQPLEDTLISLQFKDEMTLAETSPLSLGTSAFLLPDHIWKWRIPTLGANSAPITARLLITNAPEDWDERVFLRAIDPNTLEEIESSTIIETGTQ